MSLKAEVYVSPPILANPANKLPFNGTLSWSPISSTLIYGEKEAILVDTPITPAQNEALAAWVEYKLGNRKLTTIYITHGHADHFLGIGLLKKRFPGSRAVATSGTVEHMKQQVEPPIWNAVWSKYFPGQLGEAADVELAEPLTSNEFYLEGHAVQVIEVGHTDTHSSTALFVPDIRLAVCGDAVYGDVHQMMREANTTEKRLEWIKAVETIKALRPTTVVAGHKRVDGEDSPDILDTTIEYIRDFENLKNASKSSRELYDRMIEKHGGRQNPAALEGGCHVAFQ